MSATIVLMPGNEGPVNDGERRVLNHLRDHLPQGFELHPNLQLGVGRGELIECDIIVFGPDCVWVVEVKDLAPRVVFDEHEFLVGNELRAHPVRQTRTKAQKIKSRLAADPALAGVWVQPLVVLARQPLMLDVHHTMKPYVATMDRAVQVISDPTIVNVPRGRLAGDLMTRAKARLSLNAAARRPRPRFGPYSSQELLSQGEDRAGWSASHEVMGTPVLLEVIEIAPLLPRDEQDRLRAEAYRAAKVRAQLGAYPWVLAPETAFNADDGSVVVVHPDDPSPSLEDSDDLIASWTDEIKRRFVARLASTVAFCHDRDVIHRTIGARSIFVTAANTAKLGGFGRASIARTGTATVTPRDWGALGLGEWMAPELASGQADREADLYALGKVINHLWPGGAPMDLAEAATVLTDPNPAKRTITARALAELAAPMPPPPAAAAAAVATEGAMFGDRWLLQQKLGGGASGTVWKALDTNFNVVVALKIYEHADAGDEVQREYQALYDVWHPGVVRIRDGLKVGGKWALASEFLDGATLRAAVVPGNEPLSWDAAATITMKLLSALQAVHPPMPRILALTVKSDLTDDEQIELARLRSRGMVHRDVKPENVVLVADRGPVLVDFGLAAAGPAGAPGGTPQYRPPGIAFEGSNPDLDLFAVGVMLHEMLTGRHPYTDSDPIGGTLQIAPELETPIAALLGRACSPDDT
ncbi:MAG: protein kinase domain-containing protein, partial [Actinomycetes bacterium]